MRVDARSGRPIAVVVGFACHGTCVGGQTLEWGADFPATLRAEVEAASGAECLFLQGAAGDVAPFDFWFGNEHPSPHGFDTAARLGGALARSTLACLDDGRDRGRRHAGVAIHRRSPWTDERSTSTPRSWMSSKRTFEHATIRRPATHGRPSLHTTNSAQLEPADYQLGVIALVRDLASRAGSPIQAELQAIRIGPSALIAMPFEPFSEVASRIAARSTIDVTVLGYSNGYQGYLPTSEAARGLADLGIHELLDQDRIRWAYGITNAHMAASGADRVEDAAVALLGLLHRRVTLGCTCRIHTCQHGGPPMTTTRRVRSRTTSPWPPCATSSTPWACGTRRCTSASVRWTRIIAGLPDALARFAGWTPTTSFPRIHTASRSRRWTHSEQGDVVVHSTDHAGTNAPWGELMSTVAQVRGAVGCVCDSQVRDISMIKAMRFPVFTAGIRPLDSLGRARVMAYDVPVRCGGVLVSPGDIVFADLGRDRCDSGRSRGQR